MPHILLVWGGKWERWCEAGEVVVCGGSVCVVWGVGGGVCGGVVKVWGVCGVCVCVGVWV